ncbi:toxin-antitoxin system toxin subunit [Streptomyces spectabilis]|uniref:Toxin-antitoxin system toxin subunit n=1 Tax=Streptomyces spectabilis TaxID=68270 RepID=A0A516R9G0_STRST|nr:toxin-antitoxin system toxin subunit [Streptomyces spectabilis]QDQ12300.1 toxin-antitoxin system toxin subunit [Streptomyces spectabilis]
MNPHADTLTTAPDGRSVLRMERRVGHPPEKVRAALTRSGYLKPLLPAEVRVDPEPGGSLLTLTHTFDDRFAAPSLAAGWHLRLSALGEHLDGVAEPARVLDTGELHEAYLEQFDLGGGEVTADGTVRFERQLVRPADAVWAALTEGDEVLEGSEAPEGIVADGVPAGDVTAVRVPETVTYDVAGGGEVSIRLGPGTEYGARLVLTHRGAGDPAAARAAWHARLERLAGRLLEG